MSFLRPDLKVGRVERAARTALAIVGCGLVVLAIALVWRYTALSELASPERIGRFLIAARGEPWALLLVLAVFLAGGLIAFPVNILVLATAATFGPWLGLLYSSLGALSSGVVMYYLGARLGRDALERRLSDRLKRALGRVRRRGLVAVVMLRVVPLAPATVINLAVGASAIKFSDFFFGSILGMAPGFVVLSVMGDRIMSIIAHPSVEDFAILAACIIAWIGLAVGVQALTSRFGGRA